MASYQVHLRPIVDWDAKPLPPLPLDPARSFGPFQYKPALNTGKVPRRGNMSALDLDIRKLQEADSRVVRDKPPRRRRPSHQLSPTTASAPDRYMPMRRDDEDTHWHAVPGKRPGHSRQTSDQPTSRYTRSRTPAPAPAFTRAEDLSLPPKVRQIIGIDSPRNPRAPQWNPVSTQALPSPTAPARPLSITSVYSQASGFRRETDMLFHMEEIVEEREKAEDDDEIRRRLESMMQSPGFAAIRCIPDGPAPVAPGPPHLHLLSPPPAAAREDETRQPTTQTQTQTQTPTDHRSSREMYHDLVVELAQSAPAALPPPPKPPVPGADGTPPELSSSPSPSPLRQRRDRSSLSEEPGQQLHRGDAPASCPQMSRKATRSPHVSVFDHESSDSESDSESRPLWSPKFAFLGRRPVSKPSKRK